LSATICLTCTISFAQSGENSNPYAIFGGNPHIAGERSDAERVKVLVIENIAEGSRVARLEHDTRTGVVMAYDSDGNIVRERKLKKGERAWPTMDRFAEKYYSHSPYSYAVGNPVNVIDIRGDSIWYTRQDNVITMHVTGNVINQSSSNINMQRRAENIASGIANAFTGTVEMNGQEYNMVVDAQIGVASSMADVASSDHLFVYADRNREANIQGEGVTSEFGGKVMTLYSGASTRSAVHEFGHAAGLGHKSATGPFNIMNQGQYFGASVSSYQRQLMIQQYSSGGVNRGANSFNPNPYNPNSTVIPNPYVIVPTKNGYVRHHINDAGFRYR
jgi:hypothetical protein